MLSFGSGASTDGRGGAIGITVGSGTSGDGGIVSLLSGRSTTTTGVRGVTTGERRNKQRTLNIVTANAGASELAAVSYSLREHRVLATGNTCGNAGALQMVREGPCG